MKKTLAFLLLALPFPVQAQQSLPTDLPTQAQYSPATLPDAGFAARLERATNGNIPAMVAVGLDYLRGEVVARECYEGKRWLKKAADLGSLDALFNLGIIEDNGACGLAEGDIAFVYFKTAAEKGHAGAQYQLGQLYQSGRGGTRDDRLALKWYGSAARKGEALAYCGLAQLYARGYGVKKDKGAAKKWATKGLNSGNSEAALSCAAILDDAGLNP